MNILVVFTGGTIGSAVENGWISTDDCTRYKLIGLYKNKTDAEQVNFDTTTPYYILSENLSAVELTKLCECIRENLTKNYDGIIVTHGTDTLQYTAAALSYVFSDIKIPIVLVSSAYPLDDVRANGVDNFSAAVSFIKEQAGTGVFVSYKNNFENKVNIHVGTRLVSHMEASADVFSIDNNPYAFCDNGQITLNERFISGKNSQIPTQFKFCEYPKVLVVDCHPGDEFNYCPKDYNAIILMPFHSATLNTDNVKFKEFMNRAVASEIPVFMVNASTGVQYESAKLYEELKITVLPTCTKPAIYMKCWIAVSLGDDVEKFVKNPVAQEFIVKGDIK